MWALDRDFVVPVVPHGQLLLVNVPPTCSSILIPNFEAYPFTSSSRLLSDNQRDAHGGIIMQTAGKHGQECVWWPATQCKAKHDNISTAVDTGVPINTPTLWMWFAGEFVRVGQAVEQSSIIRDKVEDVRRASKRRMDVEPGRERKTEIKGIPLSIAIATAPASKTSVSGGYREHGIGVPERKGNKQTMRSKCVHTRGGSTKTFTQRWFSGTHHNATNWNVQEW
ncbi:hypothetical protein B0H12DRAFT_1079960 [Mycena haematopus]|nr:hypothetical protein B0H12DRAFT_1079960 [Mycena haematopus]